MTRAGIPVRAGTAKIKREARTMAKAKKSKRKARENAMAASSAAKAPAKKSALIPALVAAFVIFTAVEIYLVVQKTMRQNKRPEFVGAFPNTYKTGMTSIGEYGNYLYGVDNTSGKIYKINKQNGTLEKLFELDEQVYSAVEDTKGDVYFLDKQNSVQVFGKDNVRKKVIKLEGMQNASWLEIDSKDNFYVVDGSTSVITKYDASFIKMASFGGRGEGKVKFVNAGKLYAGPKDELYCINMFQLNDARIKILDSNGKFIKEWPVKQMAKFSNLENLAITKDGYVYINSFEGSAVYVFNNNGKFMGKFDTDKNKKFLITYPASMTGGKNGLLYIPTHNLAVFKPVDY